jgi:hypothetical protein
MPACNDGKGPIEAYFTVQASAETLRKALPPGTWIAEMTNVIDGKSRGEAIRTTGGGLVFVRFPENGSGRPLSFTIPKQFLIPASGVCSRLKREGMMPDSPRRKSGHSASRDEMGGSFASASGSTMHQHNSKEHHDLVELDLRLGAKGEPMLCVVCGTWDQGRGQDTQKRKSGHKCLSCIGKKSMPRLRDIFGKLDADE